MNLTQELEKRKQESKASAEPRIARVLDAEIDDLSRSGIDDRALKIGDTAPDFELSKPSGELVRLSDRLPSGPAIISFYRGGWCQYCNLELIALENARSRFEDLGAYMMAISPQRPEQTTEMAEKQGLTYDLLSDPGNIVAQKFGIVFHLHDEMQSIYDEFGLDLPVWNGDESFDLPVPATYVVDSESRIRMAFVDPDYTKRLDPSEIIRALRSIGTNA
jgi:peroxiredoxin